MSQDLRPVSPPPIKAPLETHLIPYDPSDDIVYKRRFQIIKSLVYALEDENNLIAWKIAQIQQRLERAKTDIPPQVRQFGLPLSPSPGSRPVPVGSPGGSIGSARTVTAPGVENGIPGEDTNQNGGAAGVALEDKPTITSAIPGAEHGAPGPVGASKPKKPRAKPKSKKAKEEARPQPPSSPPAPPADFDGEEDELDSIAEIDVAQPESYGTRERPPALDDEDELMDDY